MASNPTPTNDDLLLLQCQAIINGTTTLDETRSWSASAATALAKALENCRAGRASVPPRKQVRATARAAFREIDRETELAIGSVRLWLVALFGIGYNAYWQEAGFPDESTMVPEVFAKRLALLQSLEAYFTAHPDFESSDLGATAANCRKTLARITSARTAVETSQEELRVAVEAKRRAFAHLRKQFRAAIDQISVQLPSDDPRWRDFGLNVPASQPPPVPASGLELVSQREGTVHLRWSPAQHADSYRVEIRELGMSDFASLTSTEVPEAELTGLPPGQFVEVRVTPINSAGEASPSPAIMIGVR